MNENLKCQSIYWNLLVMLEKDKSFWHSVFIRELWQTKKCDEIYNLEQLRNNYINHMSKETHERVIQFKSTPTDELKATQSVFHYRMWTKKKLIKGLTWTNWLSFYTWHKVQNIFN